MYRHLAVSIFFEGSARVATSPTLSANPVKSHPRTSPAKTGSTAASTASTTARNRYTSLPPARRDLSKSSPGLGPENAATPLTGQVAVRVAVSVYPVASSPVYTAQPPAHIGTHGHAKNDWSGLIICRSRVRAPPAPPSVPHRLPGTSRLRNIAWLAHRTLPYALSRPARPRDGRFGRSAHRT